MHGSYASRRGSVARLGDRTRRPGEELDFGNLIDRSSDWGEGSGTRAPNVNVPFWLPQKPSASDHGSVGSLAETLASIREAMVDLERSNTAGTTQSRRKPIAPFITAKAGRLEPDLAL
jgi:hypothetical protein